jgi:peptidoglycan/xylan/chitin deacetylase (PgdA/CDA1 family)
VILLYHGIVEGDAPPEKSCAAQALPLPAFVRHLGWIRRRHRIVPLAEYLEAAEKRDGAGLVALTLDDGLERTYALAAPFLRAERIPATFFISSGHLDGGELLWFTALDALCFEGTYRSIELAGRVLSLASVEEMRRSRRALGAAARDSGDARDFVRTLRERYPLPETATLGYRGMSQASLSEAAADSLFEIGSHTRTHPYLSRRSFSGQREEISGGREDLERRIGRPVRYFAYPGGDYDERTLRAVREAKLAAAFATTPRRLEAGGDGNRFEIERVGIYSPPLWKVALKATGVVPIARRLGVAIG